MTKKTHDQGVHENDWQRFERAVDAAVKGGPKHKAAAPKGMSRKERPASKGRVHKGKTRD